MSLYTSYTVEVTQEFIDAGKPMTCNFCPIALGIKAATPFKHYVAVLKGEVWLSNDPTRPRDDPASHYAKLPRAVQQFINRFDSDEPVRPFEFVLKVRTS